MHPFDLSPEEIAELKEEFPEFQKKKTESSQQRGQKNMGLTIEKLKQLLREKIKVTDEQMEVIISKFDHKSESKITWTEFLSFLSSEGQRREIVNDAQLYGFGVKRIEFKERIKLTGTKDKPVSDKAVEYYIEKLVLIQSDKFQLLLTIFENN
jgi:Ca2+-binding EF-hand superfamily protein